MKDNYKFLDDERKKIWDRIVSIEKQLDKKIIDYEKDLKVNSKFTSEHRNKCRDTLLEAQKLFSEIKQIQENINLLSEIISKNKDNIETIYSDLNSKIEYIDEYISHIDTGKEKIENQINTLNTFFNDRSTYESNIEQLNDFFNSGSEVNNKIISLHKGLLAKKREIDDFHREIFGYVDQDDSGNEITVDGQKAKLKMSYDDISVQVKDLGDNVDKIRQETNIKYNNLVEEIQNDYSANLASWQQMYDGVISKINSLLPDALTAGLSSAYHAKRITEEKEMGRYENQFRYSILGLILVSIIPFIVSTISWLKDVPLKELIFDLPRLVLGIFPLYIPVLWIAYSSNKRINLSKRLIEEYSHKEVLSKTFEGLSGQIQSIDNEQMTKDLRIKLLYNIISVSSENPGKLITDYNTSDHPLTDALNKSIQLANAVEKLSNFPGLKSVSKFLDGKSDRIQRETSDKVEKGLEIIEK